MRIMHLVAIAGLFFLLRGWTVLIPQQGEGLAFAKLTLPRKKPNAIDRIITIFRINGIRLFDSPPDAEGFPLCDSSCRPDHVVKPPATPSFRVTTALYYCPRI